MSLLIMLRCWDVSNKTSRASLQTPDFPCATDEHSSNSARTMAASVEELAEEMGQMGIEEERGSRRMKNEEEKQCLNAYVSRFRHAKAFSEERGHVVNEATAAVSRYRPVDMESLTREQVHKYLLSTSRQKDGDKLARLMRRIIANPDKYIDRLRQVVPKERLPCFVGIDVHKRIRTFDTEEELCAFGLQLVLRLDGDYKFLFPKTRQIISQQKEYPDAAPIGTLAKTPFVNGTSSKPM